MPRRSLVSPIVFVIVVGIVVIVVGIVVVVVVVFVSAQASQTRNQDENGPLSQTSVPPGEGLPWYLWGNVWQACEWPS